ncbi:hypothetical protein BOW53_15685 [Solemya pervernicosa gill symbiont]|uniref:HTH tetR-type domain-containing protein n=1 Tax=Solemya pervernicosa gill symbiont TaxID=642797 RepID=A0A1T2L049_9GAMM|nr:TetR/AcrR family transcriptional regulator [Solemya pervernicosa gill symbiont]OOZ38390.1 hypothetical protein BOW53_15685 [Solemya pervernicosa gill symbiont]
MAKKGEENRKRIIEAANDLFYRKGYSRSSFSEVADASGIPKGNFYYYFKSKEELLDSVIDDRLEQMREMLASWDSGFQYPKLRLHRFAQVPLNELEGIVQYGCPMGSLNVELGKDDAGSKAHAAEMFTLFVDWLEKQFREMGYAEQSRDQALHLLSVAQGASLLSYVYSDGEILEKEMKRLHDWIESLEDKKHGF